MRRESSLETETLVDIQKVSKAERGARGCTCSKQMDGRWFVCGYHEGFDDGVAAAKEAFMREAEAERMYESFMPSKRPPNDVIYDREQVNPEGGM